ncbi:hypothetical protein RJ639_019980, partial [Escallonia herrerae]
GVGVLVMDHSPDICGIELDGDGWNGTCGNSSTSYRLFGRQSTVHQIMGGGKAADVILWKRQHISFAIIVVSTVAWLVFERSGLSFLTICSNVFLILIVLLFLRANYDVSRNKQLQTLPELLVSEEMVNNAAASFRVKINYALLMAHDITLGKDFRLFFKAVVGLWLLSVIGSLISFFTLAYIGTILFVTLPALYNRYEEHVDRYAGLIHQKLSKHYKVADESVSSRFPRSLFKEKDS